MTAEEPQPHAGLHAHVLVLVACLGIFVVAAVLTPPESASSPIEVGGVGLPSACSFKAMTGIRCPGCGLTRSVVAAVHGDVRASVDHHRLGLVVVLYIALQVLAQAGTLVSPWWRRRGSAVVTCLNLLLLPLAAALVLNWIPTLFQVGSELR